MQHYIGPKGLTKSYFVCGADAVGRRNTRLDTDPMVTTCAACKRTTWWQEAYKEATTA